MIFKTKKRQYHRLWGIILLILIAGLGLGLALKALEENIIFFYAPAELVNLDEKPSVVFRLGGLVEQDSYQQAPHPKGTLHRFDLSDGAETITVHYQGILPDLFREGQGIIGKGVWQNNKGGIFVATELLAKHDENYMPAEIANSLKESGQWRDGYPEE